MRLQTKPYQEALSRLATKVSALPASRRRDQRLKHLRKAARVSDSHLTRTSWRILSHEVRGGEPVTRVELTPVTGKTHQLRLACVHGLGSAIVGDAGYAGGGGGGAGMCLHAREIVFEHPEAGVGLVRARSLVPF
ncbi:hypothetical protein TeGR_g3902 [Tetraparma gracilis]|uniref:Pseudouridine synthase RsuA/RluA-like domain-containing protein n=1 Tax=Tetraparma gracilis TaxID=2962635 RepID=A0ABQ6M3G5_9STRA|nr:hypothetical protein TeGR_g3902 [Tetraparma gracilis]